ncbi:Las1-like [Sesbania bispinosa]|nr:Las1-like [Sesbania bispinosa]
MEAALLGFKEEPEVEDDTKPSSSAWRYRHGEVEVHCQFSSTSLLLSLKFITKDPYFRQDQSNDDSLSEEMLAMLYCMAIVRLVNGVVEKTRKKELVSIAVAADAIGIPRMLIDIRHEGSHRELPSLKVVRSASIKALDWLKSYYWEPQSKAIPFQGEGNVKVKKEIKSKIRELAVCMKVNGNSHSSTALLKGKRVKHGELLFGRNKLLSLMVAKSQTSRLGGSKKQITKILKAVLQLYSSFSSEIVSVLLEYLLKALSSSDFNKNADDASVSLTMENVLVDWKLVLLKLCNKEPELLLSLLTEVLDMIEIPEDMKCVEDNPSIGISHSREELRQIDYLSSLFAWLVGILSKVPSAAANMPKRVLLELLRRCLLISQLCNKQLMDAGPSSCTTDG